MTRRVLRSGTRPLNLTTANAADTRITRNSVKRLNQSARRKFLVRELESLPRVPRIKLTVDRRVNLNHRTVKVLEKFGLLFRKSSSSSSSNKCVDGSKMGQTNSVMNRYKHHKDPILLNRQTLEVREHMFGDSDLTIVVGDVRFPVHRDVLMEQSFYFKAMLTQFEERFQKEVELKCLAEPALIGQILHYMYFKHIYLTPKNVQDLICLANYLQMENLQRVCSEYMQQRIDKQNCVALYLYTLTMGPYDLQCHAEDFILTHFEQVVRKSKDFVNLSKDQLLRIISSDRLLISTEGTVYKAVISWVGHDTKNRSCHLPLLLEHVHFPLMSLNEVEQYRRDSKVIISINKTTEQQIRRIAF